MRRVTINRDVSNTVTICRRLFSPAIVRIGEQVQIPNCGDYPIIFSRLFQRRTWILGAPKLVDRAGSQRVSASIDGQPIWFETADVPLCASPEAYATLLFIPALMAGMRLRSEALLDANWLSSTVAIPPLLNEWWGYANQYPLENAPSVCSANGPAGQRGLFFTGGVDSTHALLHYQQDVDALIFVHGFDIDIDDQLRADAFEKSLRMLAAGLNKQAIVIRTNARKHKLFKRFNWERTHGGALSAVGHLLAGTFGRVLISGSWCYTDPHPWGSRWDLDPLWSSRQMLIEHADSTLSRQEKIGVIAAEPIAQQYLRVCWENLSPTGNCCRCAKCLRTMLSLKAHGVLDKYTTFERDINLVERLDALPGLSASLHGRAREQLAELTAYPELQAALIRLIERRPG